MCKLAIMQATDVESLAALDSAERTMTSLGANLLVKTPIKSLGKGLASKPQSLLLIRPCEI